LVPHPINSRPHNPALSPRLLGGWIFENEKIKVVSRQQNQHNPPNVSLDLLICVFI